jgi:hypothetical protein
MQGAETRGASSTRKNVDAPTMKAPFYLSLLPSKLCPIRILLLRKNGGFSGPQQPARPIREDE